MNALAALAAGLPWRSDADRARGRRRDPPCDDLSLPSPLPHSGSAPYPIAASPARWNPSPPSPAAAHAASIAVPGGTALLLDESYNGNGASMRAALAVLALQPATRRIAVLGDMLELGDAGPAEHAALADPVTRAADLLFACGPLMRHLFDTVPPHIRAAHAADSAALAPIVAQQVAPGDAILVKGSLGSRMKTIVNALDALTAETR